jgi:hypothetical protein
MGTSQVIMPWVVAFLAPLAAMARTEPFVGGTKLVVQSVAQGEFTFQIEGRVTPLDRVSGSGKFSFKEQTSNYVGTMILLDGQGDKVVISFQFVPNQFGGFVGSFKITGGTGQWTGSKGGGTISGWIGDVTYLMAFDGVITD